MRQRTWRRLAALAFLAGWTSGAYAQPADPILYRNSGAGLYDGAFGPIHAATTAANAALARCGAHLTVDTSGAWKAATTTAFRTLAACPEFTQRLSPQSPARRGALTAEFWVLLVGTPPPSALDRARTLMLTFEATDYSALEWNYCQSRPLYVPPRHPVCHSNDPTSFITWGPNGATAGGGREVQAILRQIAGTHPALLSGSFGAESPAVTKMLSLQGRPVSKDTEVFLCGVWASTRAGKRGATGSSD